MTRKNWNGYQVNVPPFRKNKRKYLHTAHDPNRGKMVVIKRFLGTAQSDREVAALKRCSGHKNIVQFYDYFTIDGDGCIVMERVPGKSLRDVVRRRRRFRRRRAVAITISILKALEHMHKRGYVYRDLSPGNVMVRSRKARSGKIIDLGAALPRDKDGYVRVPGMKDKRRSRLKKGDLVKPPERYLVDDTYDVFYAACLCVYMLVGRPVAGKRVLWRIRNRRLRRVLRKALARRRKNRFQSAKAFRKALVPFR